MKPHFVDPSRLRVMNSHPPRPGCGYVLYWMTSARRMGWNFGLDHALAWCHELSKPLVVFEPLRCDYRWASDRMHRFVIEGMDANAATVREAGGAVAGEEGAATAPLVYLPWIESQIGEGKGLLTALARDACVVVGDDYPCFFLTRMVEAAARSIAARLELVDSNGLLPIRAADRVFGRAFDFRRFVQKSIPQHVGELPLAEPLRHLPSHVTVAHNGGANLLGAVATGGEKLTGGRAADRIKSVIDTTILPRWRGVRIVDALASGGLAALPIDHAVTAAVVRGGSKAARKRLAEFVKVGLPRYGEDRNHPDLDGGSGLSPWLHFGHVSAHEVFDAVVRREKWSPRRLGAKVTAKREGWWGMSEASEGFLDELVTWREVGFNFCSRRPDYDRFESLPDWALATIAKHADDTRAYLYSAAQLETAATHDPLWNAAQRQLAREGRMHNYLRMLWGKKIVEWSKDARTALAVMIDLNNKYAVDGRDPNSYSGIFWVLGRCDRAWGPERPVMGTLRYMTSESTMRKLRVKEYLKRYGPSDGGLFG